MHACAYYHTIQTIQQNRFTFQSCREEENVLWSCQTIDHLCCTVQPVSWACKCVYPQWYFPWTFVIHSMPMLLCYTAILQNSVQKAFDQNLIRNCINVDSPDSPIDFKHGLCFSPPSLNTPPPPRKKIATTFMLLIWIGNASSGFEIQSVFVTLFKNAPSCSWRWTFKQCILVP